MIGQKINVPLRNRALRRQGTGQVLFGTQINMSFLRKHQVLWEVRKVSKLQDGPSDQGF